MGAPCVECDGEGGLHADDCETGALWHELMRDDRVSFGLLEVGDDELRRMTGVTDDVS